MNLKETQQNNVYMGCEMINNNTLTQFNELINFNATGATHLNPNVTNAMSGQAKCENEEMFVSHTRQPP